MAEKRVICAALCMLSFVGLHFVDAAKSNAGKDDISLQRQFDEFKSAQEFTTKLADERTKRLEDMVHSQQQIIADLGERIESMETKLNEEPSKRLVLDNGYVESGRVAFSAYMDHDMDNFTLHDKVVFNKPHYNDGNFYNLTSGVFTVPMEGVYLFIYFIGARHKGEIDAELTVNGVLQNEAVAEGLVYLDDRQGGNSAILKLHPGDKVWIDMTRGFHVEGSWRFNTFTGALLYPVFT